MSEKTKKYIVVCLKSPESSYRKYCKMSKQCFDGLKPKKVMKHDPIVHKHVQMTLSRSK